jgi:hypothetical protein
MLNMQNKIVVAAKIVALIRLTTYISSNSKKLQIIFKARFAKKFKATIKANKSLNLNIILFQLNLLLLRKINFNKKIS